MFRRETVDEPITRASTDHFAEVYYRGYRTADTPALLVTRRGDGWGTRHRDRCVRRVCLSIDDDLAEAAALAEFAAAQAAAAPAPISPPGGLTCPSSTIW